MPSDQISSLPIHPSAGPRCLDRSRLIGAGVTQNGYLRQGASTLSPPLAVHYGADSTSGMPLP
jgi:hypothetical protein